MSEEMSPSISAKARVANYDLPAIQKGNEDQAKGDIDRAIADETKAIEIDPKDASAYHNPGTAYLTLDRFDKAIADYDVALKLNPNLAFSFLGYGIAKQNKGDHAGGDADFTAALTKGVITNEFARLK